MSTSNHRYIWAEGFAVSAIAAAVLIGGILFSPGKAAADEDTEAVEASQDWLGGIPAAPTEEWNVSFGGRLYDNWFNALDVEEPTETHPSYPPGAKKEGATTWRCKECHGWDYKGDQGAYAKGSHYTGIKGVAGQVGADPQTILRILRDETHQYSEEMIPESAMQRLALFVTRGQHETDWYIDSASKRARGNAPRGERYFQNICAPCHGFDGRAINFHAEGDPEYIGTVAAANPWEALHKIRNGQPGQPMPVLRVLPLQDLVNILAYAQTLPQE